METKNYEQFKILDCNRSLNRNHINQIKKDITALGYLEGLPILVSENMEIIDGQHRFIACKEMGLPIIYQVVPGSVREIIPVINTTQKKWKIEDYVNFWSKTSYNPNFMRLLNLSKEENINITTILTISKGSSLGGDYLAKVKQGDLKFTAEDTLKVRSFVIKFHELCKALRLKPTTKLCSALVQLSAYPNFKWSTLISKARNHRTLAYNCRTKEEFIVMLKDLYNYKLRKEENRLC